MTVHVVLGEFNEPSALISAVRTLRGEHVRTLDTHTPHPLPGLESALGVPRSPVPWFAFGGGAAGAVLAWALQAWLAGAAASPAFVPVTLALMLLGAALATALSLVLHFWQLPATRHPVFRHDAFVKTASTSGLWLSVSTQVPEDADRAKGRLEALGAKNVTVVTEPSK